MRANAKFLGGTQTFCEPKSFLRKPKGFARDKYKHQFLCGAQNFLFRKQAKTFHKQTQKFSKQGAATFCELQVLRINTKFLGGTYTILWANTKVPLWNAKLFVSECKSFANRLKSYSVERKSFISKCKTFANRFFQGNAVLRITSFVGKHWPNAKVNTKLLEVNKFFQGNAKFCKLTQNFLEEHKHFCEHKSFSEERNIFVSECKTYATKQIFAGNANVFWINKSLAFACETFEFHRGTFEPVRKTFAVLSFWNSSKVSWRNKYVSKPKSLLRECKVF